jgi:hypothetical protein
MQGLKFLCFTEFDDDKLANTFLEATYLMRLHRMNESVIYVENHVEFLSKAILYEVAGSHLIFDDHIEASEPEIIGRHL